MADIVFLFDESGSAFVDHAKPWLLNSLVPRFADSLFSESLASKGITDIRYGLVGFGGGDSNDYAHSHLFPSTNSDRQTGADWTDGDLDSDGTVDEDDYHLAFAQFGLALNVAP